MAIYVMFWLLVSGLPMVLAKLYGKFDRWMHRRKKWEKEVAVGLIVAGIAGLVTGAIWVSQAAVGWLRPPKAVFTVKSYRLQPLVVDETPAVDIVIEVKNQPVEIKDTFSFEWAAYAAGHQLPDGSVFVLPKRFQDDKFERMRHWRASVDEMWTKTMCKPLDSLTWQSEKYRVGTHRIVVPAALTMRMQQPQVDAFKGGAMVILLTGLMRYGRGADDIWEISAIFFGNEVAFGLHDGPKDQHAHAVSCS